MDVTNMLSGSQLVAKGATKKAEGQLPQVGLKEVTPNGSWLEQKQIQSALEAHKYLIAVERIEKSGSITHAEWRDDLKLAEVIKQTGGHWQYIGHKRGKYLYLAPEETLFLLETNNLILRHNGVTVSMKKAFQLCLHEMPLIQYKVYASLSRLGYRVLKHKEKNDTNTEETSQLVTIDAVPLNSEPNNILNIPANNTNVTENEALPVTMDTDPTNSELQDNIVNIPEKDSNARKNKVEITQPVSMDTDPTTSEQDGFVNIAENNMNVIENEEKITQPVTKNIQPTNSEQNSVVNVPDNNLNETETADNTIDLTDTPSIDTPDITVNNSNDIVILEENITETSNTSMSNNVNDESSNINKEAESTIDITDSENNSECPRMDIDDNGNETIAKSNENYVVPNQEMTEATMNEAIALEAADVAVAAIYSVDKYGVIRPFERNIPVETDPVGSNTVDIVVNCTSNTSEANFTSNISNIDSSRNNSLKHFQIELTYYDNRIQQLNERKTVSAKEKLNFDVMKDLHKRETVTISAPDEKYLPRNVFLDKTEYKLNIEVVRTQNASNVNDENDSISDTPAPTANPQGMRVFPRYGFNTPPRFPTYQHRPYMQRNYNFMYRNMPYYYPRFQPNTYVRHYAFFNSMHGNQNQHDRKDSTKKYHYDSIVNIAMRLKNGLAIPAQVRALQNLIMSYNVRYLTNIRLTPEFTITEAMEPENVIKIDDDNVTREPKRKKQRLNDDVALYNNNLEKLQELATKLKELHDRNVAVSRHRRVFSNALKSFNRSFNSHIDLDSNFKLVDKKTVKIDTSSDSDAVIVEKEKPKRKKKLRNPYSIFKQISKDVNLGASSSLRNPEPRTLNANATNDTSQNINDSAIAVVVDKNMKILKGFHRSRFPENDFSAPATCPKIDSQLDEPFYQTDCLDYIKESPLHFENWIDVKLAILKDIRGSLNLEKEQVDALSNDFFTAESQLQPILGPDCNDLKTALQRLAVIPTNKEVSNETSLSIHFDVCSRDVHFKKSSPPKPNFRVVCYEESDMFPSSEDIAALQSKYTDNVPIVFAFVGTTASISYLQINCIELPVYIPDNDSGF